MAFHAPQACRLLRICLCIASLLSCFAVAHPQSQTPTPARPPVPSAKPAPSTSGTPSATPGLPGGDTKSAKPELSASGKHPALGPLDPSSPPARVFTRPRIGLALGGGGALALSEVGVLQWFEEHHIPVDVIAGTSMGCMISSLYSAGQTPAQLETVMTDSVFTSVFTISSAYTARSYRRREDARELPNAITIGLKHRVSFRNALLTDQGLDAFLDREFLRYDDQTDFNTLPIPLRCVSTDLTAAVPVTFARGSLPDAVRASVSIPGVFKPFELNGHEFVDGAILENLPTPTVHAMQADVVIAVSLPLAPVGKGELDSLLGVVGRTASVAIEANERQLRKQADVVIMPDISGFTGGDYLKTPQLAERGYQAAEANRAALLQYALSGPDWQAYLAHRDSLRRGPVAPVLRVRVSAPTHSATVEVERIFAPLVNQPVDTARIEALLDQVRADGRYDADYTVGYESPEQFAAQQAGQTPLPRGTVNVRVLLKAPQTASTPPPAADSAQIPAASPPGQPSGAPIPKPSISADPTLPVTTASLNDIANRPIVLVDVIDKKTGPPFLLFGANVESQAGGITRATVEGILLDQDFLSYGAELRSHVILGYLTDLDTEYFRPLNWLSVADRSNSGTVFLAPHARFLREPFPIFQTSGDMQIRIADRELQTFSTGLDLGLTNQRTQELRAGLDFLHLSWTTSIGDDQQPQLAGNAARARLTFTRDTQDRASVPQFGFRLKSELDFLFNTGSLASSSTPSPNAPEFTSRFSFAHRFSAAHPFTPIAPDSPRGHEILAFAAEGGTFFDRPVAQPFRFTLGGPLRLSASTIDQYRGTDYFLLEPAMLRRIASLPQPLGQNIYLGGGYEFGQMRAPGLRNITRQDAFFGLVAETPLGVVTLAPALGTNGEHKFIFTLGKLF